MVKHILPLILSAAMMMPPMPAAPAKTAESSITAEIENPYIRVTVNKENGGYVIATKEGDILKKSDNDIDLTHRGSNMDTSFTSFRVEEAGETKDYIFGNDYGFLGLSSTDVQTTVDPKGQWIKSSWTVDQMAVEQTITLENAPTSEKLGTARIAYHVKNQSNADKKIKSRVLMDTRLGDQDYGYYELPMQIEGQGVRTFSSERAIEKGFFGTPYMPADYFVRDTPNGSQMVGFGINSAVESERPYRMTFAHWANIAATRFDYEPDTSMHFVNGFNGKKTGDSAAALYYDLGTLKAGTEKSFSTYYGVTANLRNKDNRVVINTTAPNRLNFSQDKTSYIGTDGKADGIIQVNVHVKTPATNHPMRVVVYTQGITAQKQTDAGTWITYSNADPSYFDITGGSEEKVNYFYFKLTPQERTQLGSFVIRVYDMDPKTNELGAYAEEFLMGSTENYIVLPGTDKSLPAITLNKLEPAIVYNDNVRYLTVTGRGMEFFKSELLEAVELRGDNGKVYGIPMENINYEQVPVGETPKTATFRVTEYMEPGAYYLHFIWKKDTNQEALNQVPLDFTSSAMLVHMSSDPQYRNDHYGVLAVVREGNNKYGVMPFATESSFEKAKNREEKLQPDNLLLTIRGKVMQDYDNRNLYQLSGGEDNITINNMLNYYGSDFVVKADGKGSVKILMNGKLTTIGANTTVRNGTAAFLLNAGIEYLIPVYDQRGELEKNGTLSGNKQDFLELKWNNSTDILTTVGGFLIDLHYGVVGKIHEDDGLSDIISFGGALDLSFITPGAAAKARATKDASDKWQIKDEEVVYDDDDGFGFGLDFDDETGEIRTQTNEKDIPPQRYHPKPAEVGANIHNVMFGGKKPGYVGINMDTHVALPHICSFLPQRIEANLGVNTIGGYQVSFDGEVETATLKLGLSLVVKSNPSGAPIPDKLFFKIGGFEPGFNVDGMGVFWLTGGGGGFDKLYDTIYGTDGLPPLTLMMNVQFDIVKIMTGEADLSLSLHGVSIEMSDVHLKKVNAIRFLDGGKVAIQWYPNFGLEAQGKVSFMKVMKGGMRISAAAGAGVKDFVEFVLSIGIGLPDFIPIVGGMELASAELGGGSEKVWGCLTLLEIIRLGFTYRWGGDVEFSWGKPDASLTSPSAKRSYRLFRAMTAPQPAGTDPKTGETMYVSVGSNLSFAAGSEIAADFDRLAAQAAAPRARFLRSAATVTKVVSSPELDNHLVTLGSNDSYLITISPKDEKKKLTTSDYERILTVQRNGQEYPLKFYRAPASGIDASDTAKQDALKNANVNVVNGVATLMIPGNIQNGQSKFLLSMKDSGAYDVAAILVNPISELTSQKAELHDHQLTISWQGKAFSETSEILVYASTGEDDGVVVNTQPIKANTPGGKATITLPESMASGTYRITLALSDEDKCFERYDAGKVTLKNSKAPEAPLTVTAENAGNHKLKVNVKAPDGRFDGYFVDVYETSADGSVILADAGLYFEKNQPILVGGEYVMPIVDKDGNPIPGQSKTVGYTPGKTYTVKVRAGNIEDTTPDVPGDEIFHCSHAVEAEPVVLKDATPPTINVSYQGNTVTVTSDTEITGELYVDGSIAPGTFYSFTNTKTYSKILNLPDGDHTMEIHGTDQEGDSTIFTKVISVDTTPPVVLLESPVSGTTFRGKQIHIMGTAETDAKYTFRINGLEIKPDGGKTPVEAGRLDCKLTIPDQSKVVNLEIQAEDAAGNTSLQKVRLTSSELADMYKVSLWCNGKPIPEDGKISCRMGDKIQLKLMGAMPDGTTIELTNDPAAGFQILGGTGAFLSGNELTVEQEGIEIFLSGSYDLGGGRMLSDGVVVASAAKAHSWNPPEYQWSQDKQSCQAVRTCKNDSTHVETVDAVVEVQQEKAPSCTASGSAVHTASFAVDWAETQTATVEIPKIKLQWVPSSAPTREQAGCMAHWSCPKCQKVYLDAEGLHEVSKTQVTLLYGDMTRDGRFAEEDCIYLLRAVVFGNTLYPLPLGSDIDGNQIISEQDAIMLLKDLLYSVNP